MKNIVCTSVILACAGSAMAGSSPDGMYNAEYGPALSVQNTGTQFGNNADGSMEFSGGSEINAAYGYVADGFLNLLITGNVQSNFNKFDIFIDSIAGGQNRLRGDNPDVDFNGLNRMGDDGSGNGLTFDAGFEADYFLTTTHGNNPIESFMTFSQILTGGGGTGGFEGGGPGLSIVGASGILYANDQSNTGGVGNFGDPNDSDPASVMTGMEFRIPLSAIGNPTGDIRIAAFINGSGHDFVSNQVIGDGVMSGNLGDPRFVDFSQIEGNQFITVAIPTPGTIGLMGLAGLAAIRRRRA